MTIGICATDLPITENHLQSKQQHTPMWKIQLLYYIALVLSRSGHIPWRGTSNRDISDPVFI